MDNFKTINIPIDHIDTAHLTNCRDSYEDIEDLTLSLSTIGLQMPIGVFNATDGSYGLVYGFRRLHAAKSLGWSHIDAMLVSASSEADYLILNLQENVTRKSLTPLEEAYAIQNIMDAGKTPEQIRSALGFSKTLITQRLALLGMSAEVKSALANDGISVGQARAISEAPSEHHERLVELAKNGATSKSLRMESDLINDLSQTPFADESVPSLPQDVVDPMPTDYPDTQSFEQDEVGGLDSIDPSIKSSLLDLVSVLVDDPNVLDEVVLAIKSVDFGNMTTKDASSLDNALSIVNQQSPHDSWGAYMRRNRNEP